MVNIDYCCAVDPIEQYKAENAELRKRLDELLRENEELKAVREKNKEEVAWLRSECDMHKREAQILQAQMEVVRLFFGGGGCNG